MRLISNAGQSEEMFCEERFEVWKHKFFQMSQIFRKRLPICNVVRIFSLTVEFVLRYTFPAQSRGRCVRA